MWSNWNSQTANEGINLNFHFGKPLGSNCWVWTYRNTETPLLDIHTFTVKIRKEIFTTALLTIAYNCKFTLIPLNHKKVVVYLYNGALYNDDMNELKVCNKHIVKQKSVAKSIYSMIPLTQNLKVKLTWLLEVKTDVNSRLEGQWLEKARGASGCTICRNTSYTSLPFVEMYQAASCQLMYFYVIGITFQ